VALRAQLGGDVGKPLDNVVTATCGVGDNVEDGLPLVEGTLCELGGPTRAA